MQWGPISVFACDIHVRTDVKRGAIRERNGIHERRINVLAGSAQNHDSTIHLLVTDVVMPNMSGGELAKELSRLRTEMKFLFVSGYGNAQSSGKYLDAPLLSKPFRDDQLIRAIKAVLVAT